MYRSILVPLDGSTFGENALPVALGVAAHTGAQLHLIHVYNPPVIPPEGGAFFDPVHAPNPDVYQGGAALGDEVRRQLAGQKEAYLESVRARLAAAAPAPVTVHLLQGDVAERVQAAADSAGAGLVVMTTHGRGPLGRFWLGSVTNELLQHLTVPLLLVHPGQERVDVGRPREFKHVLVPLDGSTLAEEVIGAAVTVGRSAGAVYTLVGVVRPVVVTNPGMEGIDFTGSDPAIAARLIDYQDHQCRRTQAYLHDVAAGMTGKGLTVQTRVVVADSPTAGILEEASRVGADLIALETHGRRGLARLFMGSVADNVIRGSTVPVLVQRHQAAGGA